MADKQEALRVALENVAQSWDGCEYDAIGETLDIGQQLRKQFAALSAVSEQKAHEFHNVSGTLFRRCIRCDDIETPNTPAICPAVTEQQTEQADVKPMTVAEFFAQQKAEQAQPCVCGEQNDPLTVHRTDGPCHSIHDAAPSAAPAVINTDDMNDSVLRGIAAGVGAEELAGDDVLQEEPVQDERQPSVNELTTHYHLGYLAGIEIGKAMAADEAAPVCHDCDVRPDGTHEETCPEAAAAQERECDGQCFKCECGRMGSQPAAERQPGEAKASLSDEEIDAAAENFDLYSIQDGGRIDRSAMRGCVRALLSQAQAAQSKDAELLDFLDRNQQFRMGWTVNIAPVGSLSLTSIIMGGAPIRDAIRAAMTAAQQKGGEA